MTSSESRNLNGPASTSCTTSHHIGNELERVACLGPEPERSGGTTLFNTRKQRTNFEEIRNQIFDKMVGEGLSCIISGKRKKDIDLCIKGNQYIKKAIEYFLCGIVGHSNHVEIPGYVCGSCSHFEPLQISCRLRVCPECDIKRVNKTKKLYEPILEKYHHVRGPYRLRFMTLTVKNMQNFTAENHNDLRKALRRFRRYVEVQKYIFKALAAFEVTYHEVGEARWDKRNGKPVKIGEYTEKEAGWHPHIHIIYYGKYFPNKPEDGRLLTKLWQKACKGLFETEITDVRSLKGDVHSALNELIQYTGKGSTLKDPDKAFEYMEMMAGRRLISTWGFKEKIGRPPKMICPICESSDWIYYKGISYEDYIARRAEEVKTLPYYIKRGEVG